MGDVLTSIPLLTVQDSDRCKLYCKVTTSRAYYKLSEKVIDGTKCGPDTSDMCVNGKCMVRKHNTCCSDILHSL